MKVAAITFAVFAVIIFERCGVSATYTQADYDEFHGTTSGSLASSWLKVFFGFLYVFTALIGGIGNGAVVCAEYHNPISKTGSRYFLSVMCASDAISSMFFLLPTYLHTISRENTWPFGSLYCSLWHISLLPLYTTSVVPLNALALDWLLAIVRPRRLPMTSKYALQLIGVMGIVTIPLALPDVLFHKYWEINDNSYCFRMWNQGTARLIFDLTILVFLRAVLCLIPVIVMFYVYGRAIIGHWRGMPEELNRYLVPEHIPENREMFKLTGILVIGFVICEFPLHFYYTFEYFGLREAHLITALLVLWLFSSKAIICPLTYFNLKRRNEDDVQSNRYTASELDGNMLETGIDTVEFQANPARSF